MNESPSGITQLSRTRVDLTGLMSVLSKHLYSTPMVALRELVQNAHDSIVRRRIEEPGWGAPARIDLSSDAEANILRITDTGAGLTDDEIHRFLATVGVGYTRTLRESGHDASGLIGMFGLGFLSAFVLAERVSVRTTSYQTPTRGHLYTSTNAEQYSVSEVPPRPVGTEIELELKAEFATLTHPAHLDRILGHYCVLLREPIHICANPVPINPEPPPWRRADASTLHPLQAQRQNIAFAARFEAHFEPICTLPVAPAGDSDAVGLLWVQDGSTYGTSDNRNLSVFVRGMLLDDNARELLPAWAGFVGGVIESQRLTPTASREDLQRDQYFEATRHALGEALIDGLAQVARQQPEAWRRVLLRHNEALLGAALCDERLFELLHDKVRIPTSHGELAASELVAGGAVNVILDTGSGFEEMLFRALGVPVAHGNRYAVVPFLRRWTQARGLRLVELGTEQGNRQLFRLDPLSADEEQRFAAALADHERLVTARFSPAELPLVVVPDREAELKRRLDEDARDKNISQAALRLARQFTAHIDSRHSSRLYLNLDNPAIAALRTALANGHPAADSAARLLKSFKIIMAGREAGHAQELNRALQELSRTVQTLITD